MSILNFIAAKDDGGGGDNWSYQACKGPVKSSPPTNQQWIKIGQLRINFTQIT